MKITPFILIPLLLFFLSCEAEDLLVIDPPQGIERDLLPPSSDLIVYREEGAGSSADLFFIEEEYIGRADDPFPFLTIERDYLIPVAEPFRQNPDVSLQDVSAKDFELVPLSRWELPGRALTVDGLSPADSGYPLVWYRYLLPRFNPELSDRKRDELEIWLQSFEDLLAQERGAERPELYWIAAVGDMMLQRGIEEQLMQGQSGLDTVFSDLLERLTSYDLLAGNLEGAVTRGGMRFPKSYNFRFRPEALPRLKEAGFDYLTVANNHCYDYGNEGFVDTLIHLQAAEIPTSGAGLTPEEAATPALFQLGSAEIRVLGLGAFPPERNGFDGAREAQVRDDRPGILWFGDRALSAVADFAAGPGIDIVMVHGGYEWRRSTAADQRRIYRALIDAGAEIVFGAHPHVLQGMEYYQSGLIYYSLGNFLFNGMQEMPYAEESLIAELGIIDGKILYRSETPVQLNGPVISRAQGLRIVEDFLSLSRNIPRDEAH